MAIPYQPNYKLQPKTGFRYSAQPFVPPQQPINAPPPLGLDGSAAAPPPVMGGQQGPAYANDPFGDNGDNQFQANNQARINQAQSYGYTQGVQNPAGIVRGIPLVGNFMADSLNMGQDSKYTFGDPGTYDQAGNVFADKGRAYDPITGAPAQSYSAFSGPDSWTGNWLGIGTPEGAFGSSSSYGKLRAAGENPVSSFLGSYDNSVYKQMDMDPSITTLKGARAARMRGANSPIENFANSITQNTINARTDEFGNLPTGPVWGTQPGDYVQSDQGPLEVTAGGQLKGPNGTTVMIDGVSFVNANVSKPETLTIAQKQVLARRTSTCFPKGTKISMADNTVKNIEDIVIGDKVISFGEDNNLVEDDVTCIHIHETGTIRSSNKMVKATLTNGKEIIATSNHPFYMPEHNGFKWIGLFEKGELVMQQDGLCYAVSNVEELGEITEKVYNFEVKSTHTYIANGIRVHNGGGDPGGGSDEDLDQDLQQDIAMASHMASNPSSNAGSSYSFSDNFDPSSSDTQALVGATQNIVNAAGDAKAAGTDMQAAVTAAEATASADPNVQNAFTNAKNITDYQSTIK